MTLSHRNDRKKAEVGDIVICLNNTGIISYTPTETKRFSGLVLDKSITVYKIQVTATGTIVYWPGEAVFLWKELK